MIKFYKCTYKGEDGLLGLRHGKHYNIAVYNVNWFTKLFGMYPIDWKVIAFRPFEQGSPIMHYNSQEEFDSTWKKCPQKSKNPLIIAH